MVGKIKHLMNCECCRKRLRREDPVHGIKYGAMAGSGCSVQILIPLPLEKAVLLYAMPWL